MRAHAVSYFDVSDAEGVELEERWDDVTSVDECVHGAHPVECAMCTSAGFIAAVSGEGGEMPEELDTVDNRMIEDIGAWIAGASALALRHAYFAIEREVERRKNEIAQEAKQLEAFDKPVRKTRKDAGTTRKKEQAA